MQNAGQNQGRNAYACEQHSLARKLDGRMDVNRPARELPNAGIWGGSDCDIVNVYSLSVD